MRDLKLPDPQRLGRLRGRLDDIQLEVAQLIANESINPREDLMEDLERIQMGLGLVFDDVEIALHRLNTR